VCFCITSFTARTVYCIICQSALKNIYLLTILGNEKLYDIIDLVQSYIFLLFSEYQTL